MAEPGLLGRTLSHYRILERLGEGGMGEVYLAQDLRLERPVALKVLRDCCGDEPVERERLLDEARLASALNHPGIAVVYEVDEVEENGAPLPFLAMEYVAGEPISAWARRAGGLDRVLEVATQAADALAHAHARGVVHRDVKPSNLLVTEAGRVKVLDFGLALRRRPARADETTRTAAPPAVVAGTLGYLAPEQAKGLPVDERADVFSFGAVLYELLAGVPPFAGETTWELAGALLHSEPPPLALAGARGAALAALVASLLAKDPAARPASMVEVAAALDAVRQGEAPAAAPALAGVAVAGFVNLSRDGEDDWIGAGLAETIAADLARLEGVAVLARERVAEARRRLGGADAAAAGDDLRLGRALGARWLVAGAVQRTGEVVRVTVRLTDVAAGAPLESWKLDARLDEIFALQDRLAGELARRLAAPGAAAPADGETTVVAAYEALSRGRLNQRTLSLEGMARAIAYFERAVALDPGYARGWAELANALADHANYLVLPQVYERALEAARTAQRLRPEWARPQREIGAILIALGREEEALAVLERARTLAPADPTVLAAIARAHFLGRADFATAGAWYQRALVLRPDDGWYWLQLAHCRTLQGELADARRAALRAVEFQDTSAGRSAGSRIVGAHMRLGHVAARAGAAAEALEHLQRELAHVAGIDHAMRSRILVELHLRLGAAQGALGRDPESHAHLAAGREHWEQRLALGADEPFTRFYAAGIHALEGDLERALEDLERCAAERPRFTIARARTEPEFQPLADHPRFRALLARADE